jgi:hypothetical protein
LDWNRAISTPQTVTPASRPPSIWAIADESDDHDGASTASRPGSTICLIAEVVEISTHLAYSALPSAAFQDQVPGSSL